MLASEPGNSAKVLVAFARTLSSSLLPSTQINVGNVISVPPPATALTAPPAAAARHSQNNSQISGITVLSRWSFQSRKRKRRRKNCRPSLMLPALLEGSANGANWKDRSRPPYNLVSTVRSEIITTPPLPARKQDVLHRRPCLDGSLRDHD